MLKELLDDREAQLPCVRGDSKKIEVNAVDNSNAQADFVLDHRAADRCRHDGLSALM